MTITLLNPLIQQTKELMTAVRGSLIHVAKNLHTIKNETNWQEYGDSWSEFCEKHLEIPQSQASKLLKNYEYYILEGKLETKDLEQVDQEKLYLATKIPGEVSENLAKAKTWSRQDFKETKKEECKNYEEIVVCRNCWSTKEKHTLYPAHTH